MDKNMNKPTDKDMNPKEGPQANERFEDANLNSAPSEQENTSGTEDEKQKPGARRMDEERNTSGYGSSQRTSPDIASGNVGPLDADLNELPSQKRRRRNL